MSLRCNLAALMGSQKIRSYSELANRSGLTRQTVQRLYNEQELETTKLETFLKLCDALKVPLNALVEYTPKEGVDE